MRLEDVPKIPEGTEALIVKVTRRLPGRFKYERTELFYLIHNSLQRDQAPEGTINFYRTFEQHEDKGLVGGGYGSLENFSLDNIELITLLKEAK